MLTPNQITQLQSTSSQNGTAPNGGPMVTGSQPLNDAGFQNWLKQSPPAPQGQTNPLNPTERQNNPDFGNAMGTLGNEIQNIPSGVVGATRNLVSDIGNRFGQAGQAMQENNAAGKGGIAPLSSQVSKGIDVAGALSGIVTDTFKDFLGPAVQGVANVSSNIAPDAQAKAGEVTNKVQTAIQAKLDAFKQAHPEMSKKLDDAGNILNAALLFAGGNPAENLVDSGIKTGTTIANVAKDTAGGLSSAAKGVVSGVSDSVAGAKSTIADALPKSSTKASLSGQALKDVTPDYNSATTVQKAKLINQPDVGATKTSITVNGKTMTLDDIHNAKGTETFKTLSPQDQQAVAQFDREQSLAEQIKTAKASGKDASDLESAYNEMKANAKPIQGANVKVNEAVSGAPRVQEGGVIKGRTVTSTSLEKEAAQELSKVKGYDPKATNLEKHQLIQKEIATRGKALTQSLKNETIAVPRKEIVSTVRNAVNEVPNESLLLQKSDPVIKNYMRVVNNAVAQNDGTLEGVLNVRKQLDAAYSAARGKMAFGSDSSAALDDVHTSARDSLTQYLIDHAKNTDVKSSLRSQWNLYRADDVIAPKSAKEGGNMVTRFAKAHPKITKAAEIGGGVLVGGEVIKHVLP